MGDIGYGVPSEPVASTASLGRQRCPKCRSLATVQNVVFCGWLPRCKGKIDAVALVGCSLLSGLLVQSVETAGPDGVREQGPILSFRL
jgi:hypothetical protein